MYQSTRHRAEFPACNTPARGRARWRTGVLALLAVVASAAAAVALLTPSDMERAEADLEKARAVVCAHEDESLDCEKAAKGHRLRAAEHQKQADEHRDITDAEWLAWHRAMADGHAQLGRARSARRDTLTHLTVLNLRLLAEAECEILRAKDARDRGTPYKVAPRVRSILAPVLAGR